MKKIIIALASLCVSSLLSAQAFTNNHLWIRVYDLEGHVYFADIKNKFKFKDIDGLRDGSDEIAVVLTKEIHSDNKKYEYTIVKATANCSKNKIRYGKRTHYDKNNKVVYVPPVDAKGFVIVEHFQEEMFYGWHNINKGTPTEEIFKFACN